MSPLAWKARSQPIRIAAAAAAVSLAATVAPAGTAHANGRYPAAGLIAVNPSDANHILVRATYGLIETSDGGGTWRWICEQSVGFSDNEDPMVSITKNGTLLGAVFNGLSVSTDRGCDWTFVGGDLADRFVVDLSVQKDAPEKAIAIASNGLGGGKFETRLFETSDDGATWTQVGADLPVDFLGLTIDAAPSDAQRLYATGRYGAPMYIGTIERSYDRGATWEKFDIPGADDKNPPYLSAIDPANPDVLYVRLDSPEADSLIVSSDGGETWITAFQGEGALLGFALSPDGETVAIGGDKDGLWTAPSDTLAFTKVSEVGVRCLTWTSDFLYACADEFKDGFHVGTSVNAGKTFTALEHLQEVCPLECPEGSSTDELCPIQWGAVALTIDAKSCDGGSGGATTTGAGGSGGGGGGGGTSGGGPKCACDVAGSDGAGGGLAAMLGAVGAALAGRRRRGARRG